MAGTSSPTTRGERISPAVTSPAKTIFHDNVEDYVGRVREL